MSIKYDPILGEIRTADGGDAASVTLSGETVTTSVAANTVYTCSDEVDSLTISAVENSSTPSIVFFQTSPTGITVTLPSSVNITEELSYHANSKYALQFQNNIAILMELSSAADLAGYGNTPHNLTSDTSDNRYTLASSSCGYDESYNETYKYYAMDSAGTNSTFATYEENLAYWQIKFNEGFVNVYSVTIDDISQMSVLQGSFDGATWTDLLTIADSGTYRVYGLPYQYYRIKKKDESSSFTALSIKEVEFRYKVNSNFVYMNVQPIKYHSYTNQIAIQAYGSGTLTYSATGLPSGLSINSSTGVISGTFPTTSSFTFTATVTNSSGKSKSATLTATKVDVTTTDTTIVKIELTSAQSVQMESVTGAVDILWGDGSETNGTSSSSASYSHYYSAAGTYYIVFKGTYTGMVFGNIYSGGRVGDVMTEVIKISGNLDGSSSNMFQKCVKITTIPVFNTSSFSSFSMMFMCCYQLQTLPVLDTSLVSNFNQCFDGGCTALTTVPAWDYSSATNMSRMFQGCTALTGTVDSTDFWDNTSVSTYNRCFWNCTQITNYDDIPSGWK